MKKYRVVLPIEVGGRIYQFGETIDLDMETAAQYAHALIAVEEEATDGGNS
jgi:hypothetical protein